MANNANLSFSATYRGHSLILSKPDSNALSVFDQTDEIYMTIPLQTSDDLVRAIAVAKEQIDEDLKT